jgi:hypothetical protein
MRYPDARLSLGRMRIVPVRIALTYTSVNPVDVKLRSLVPRDFPSGMYGIRLGRMCTCRPR